MSQSWTDNVFQTDHQGQTDLQNMENNFACLKTLFSGSSQPASMGACHPWFDTSKHVLKIRNDGDSAWYGLMHGDTSQKMWVYRNSAMSGWAVDSGISDKVLAMKGGSTYTTAGTWTQPNHTLTVSEMPSHSHGGFTGSGGAHAHDFDISGGDGGSLDRIDIASYQQDSSMQTDVYNAHIHDITSQGGGSAHNHGSTYRPAAAVGTMQYLDL